jgi:hypothetical protein
MHRINGILERGERLLLCKHPERIFPQEDGFCYLDSPFTLTLGCDTVLFPECYLSLSWLVRLIATFPWGNIGVVGLHFAPLLG